jgi:hypothetical protein
MQTTSAVEAMIARRVARGNRLDESRALLADLLRTHQGYNLQSALVYNGFATERQAQSFFEELPRPIGWDDMGSSAKDLWEDRHMLSLATQLERAAA